MSTQNINNATSNRGVSGDSAPVANVTKSKAAATEQPLTAAKRAPSQEILQQMVEQANKAMSITNSDLAFTVDESTKKTVIKVTESETGKVIMQFPSEDMLSITRAIDNAQRNVLLKTKA